MIVPEEKPNSLKIQKKENKEIDFKAKNKKKFLPKNFLRPAMRMAGIGCILLAILLILSGIGNALNIKKQSENWGQLALSNVQSAVNNTQNKNFQTALKDFYEAEQAFSEVEELISPLTYSVSKYQTNNALETADNFLKFGQNIIKSAQIFLNITQKIDFEQEKNLLTIIKQAEDDIKQALVELKKAEKNLQEAKKGKFANQFSEEIEIAEIVLADLIFVTEKANKNFTALKTLLGDKHPHTILVLFQNSREIRANGGFIGSLYFITFNNGEIIKREFKDVYDFDSQLREQIDPPEPFSYLADNWGLRDANYYPDFSQSAEQIQWFLEHTKGDSVDTIIAINEQFAEKLLNLTGDLQLAGEVINEDNFTFILSFLVEAKVYGQNSPKQILADFIPQFETEIRKIPPQLLLKTIESAINEKQLIAYSFNDKVENFFNEMGMSGNLIADNNNDQLLISHTSISANKSDGFVKEQISHDTVINLEGEIYNTLKIKRSHNWQEKDQKLFDELWQKYGKNALHSKEVLENIAGKGTNKVWTRVYLPKNSTLISTKNIDNSTIKTYKENEFTVISFYFPLLNPGDKKEVELYYSLAKKLNFDDGFETYGFCFQKSAGIYENILRKNYLLESGLEIMESTDKFPFLGNLKQDKCFRVLIGKESFVN